MFSYWRRSNLATFSTPNLTRFDEAVCAGQVRGPTDVRKHRLGSLHVRHGHRPRLFHALPHRQVIFIFRIVNHQYHQPRKYLMSLSYSDSNFVQMGKPNLGLLSALDWVDDEEKRFKVTVFRDSHSITIIIMEVDVLLWISSDADQLVLIWVQTIHSCLDENWDVQRFLCKSQFNILLTK